MMISALNVENFRSLKSVRVQDLSRVNIVVGRSAAGKTALLEAIRLAKSCSPRTAMEVISQRGAPFYSRIMRSKEQYDGFWSGLFTDFDSDRAITFDITEDKGLRSSALIEFNKEIQVAVSPRRQVDQAIANPPFSINPVLFHSVYDSKEDQVLMAQCDENGLMKVEESKRNELPGEYFASNWQVAGSQAAQWFSELSIFNKEIDIIETMREHFPEIMNLTLQNIGTASVLHAAMRGVSRKIPLSLVSAGINKFICILIAIKKFEGGTVLIDEIENGIFYQLLPHMWMAIVDFASQSDVQIFASTHSLECLKACTTAIVNNESKFCLIQTVHRQTGSEYFSTSGENAAAAIEGGLEVRR